MWAHGHDGSSIPLRCGRGPDRAVDDVRSGGRVGAVLAAALLWGTTGTVAHQAPAGSSQLAVGLATFGFGGLVLLSLSWHAVVRVLRDRSARWLVAVGVVGYSRAELPPWLRGTGAWAGPSGSLLLWLTLMIIAVVLSAHRSLRGDPAARDAPAVQTLQISPVSPLTRPLGTNARLMIQAGVTLMLGLVIYGWRAPRMAGMVLAHVGVVVLARSGGIAGGLAGVRRGASRRPDRTAWGAAQRWNAHSQRRSGGPPAG